MLLQCTHVQPQTGLPRDAKPNGLRERRGSPQPTVGCGCWLLTDGCWLWLLIVGCGCWLLAVGCGCWLLAVAPNRWLWRTPTPAPRAPGSGRRFGSELRGYPEYFSDIYMHDESFMIGYLRTLNAGYSRFLVQVPVISYQVTLGRRRTRAMRNAQCAMRGQAARASGVARCLMLELDTSCLSSGGAPCPRPGRAAG